MDVNEKLYEIEEIQQKMNLSDFDIMEIYLPRKLFEEIQNEKCFYSNCCSDNFLFGIPVEIKDNIDNYQLVIQPKEKLANVLYRESEEYKRKQLLDKSFQELLNNTTKQLFEELNIDKSLNGMEASDE